MPAPLAKPRYPRQAPTLRRPRRAGLSGTGADVYANTPETDLFLDREKPSYVGGMLEMANSRLYPFWGGLTEALRNLEVVITKRWRGLPIGARHRAVAQSFAPS